MSAQKYTYNYAIRLARVIDGFLKGCPDEQPDIEDSMGNYDDVFWDGFKRAQWSLKKDIDALECAQPEQEKADGTT